ncbi:MAG TPA: lysylphosphatidylglycerol synthase transmembrane domain-containing protein [Candidatus Thermoplasmatota archaeon]|nr:lysylphosphatidylglycerol synthase transmembrane domain-containing protein [Candidatus Thermoplasmatota archaeon]
MPSPARSSPAAASPTLAPAATQTQHRQGQQRQGLPRHRRRLRVAAGLACGAALVSAMLALSGPGEVVEALVRARWGFVGLAFVSYTAFFLVRGLRWRLLLGPGGADAGTAALATAFGWLVSTFVPMKAGDVVRAAWVGRRHRNGVAEASGSVALERLLDIGGLAVACTLALLLLRAQGDAVPAAVGEAVAIAWLLPALGLSALVALGSLVTPDRRRNALLRFGGRALDQARLLLDRPRLWVPVGVLTAGSTLAQVLVYVFLVLAFLPLAPPALVLAGVPLFLLSFAVAFTPGHLGTYEAAFVVVFSSLGLGSEQLLAIAFAVHLLTVSMVTVLGGLSAGALLARDPLPKRIPGPHKEGSA